MPVCRRIAAMLFILPASCNAQPAAEAGNASSPPPASPANAAVADVAEGGHRESGARPFISTPVASFDEPWAMTFLGKGPYALVT